MFFPQWWTWSEIIGGKNYKEGAAAYIISYIFYVLWAVGFATLAASLVRTFAPYSAGSGMLI